MPDTIDDKKELATNRLLEVLRGEVEDVEDVDTTAAEPREQLGLSDEEREALDGMVTDERKGTPADFGKLKTLVISGIRDTVKSRIMPLIAPASAVAGVSIDTDTLKYVLLTTQNRRYVLKNAGIVHFDEDIKADPAQVTEFVRKTLHQAIPAELWKNCSFSTIIRGTNVSIKKVSLPKMAKNEMKEAIIWNARKDLPFEAEDTLFDYKILGDVTEQGIEKTEVLVGAVDSSLLNEHLGRYASLDIEPVKVLTVPLALFFNYLNYVGDDGDDNSVVIDIGSRVSNIVFINKGSLQFAREIAIGGDDITEALVGTISTSDGMVKITRDEAEKLKLEYGIPEEGTASLTENGISLNQLSSMMRPSLERLQTQIQRSLDYYRSKFPYGEPDKIFLSGGTARMKHFVEYLSESMGREVEILNPLKNVAVDPELAEKIDPYAMAPSFSTIMGTVYAKQLDINLLPHEMKMKPVWKKQVKILTWAAVFLFIVMGFFTIMAASEAGSVQNTVDELDTRLRQATRNERIVAFQAEYDQLNARNNMFQTNIQQYSGDLILVEYLKLLSKLTPNYITLNSVTISTINGRKMIIQGSISVSLSDNVMYLARYTNRLKESGMFKVVSPYQEMVSTADQQQAAAGRTVNYQVLNFQIECTM